MYTIVLIMLFWVHTALLNPPFLYKLYSVSLHVKKVIKFGAFNFILTSKMSKVFSHTFVVTVCQLYAQAMHDILHIMTK